MSGLETRASLRRLSEVLERPAPINEGHARYVRRLIGGFRGVSDFPVQAASGAPERLAAIAPEDPAEENPAF